MKYNRQLNYQKRQRFLLKVKLVVGFFLLLVVVAAVLGYYAIVTTRNANTDTTSTSGETSGYFAPTVKIFRSPYFQFQANNTWVEVPAESTATKFVYRSLRANLIENELTIYVNDIPATLAANRVLPVNIKDSLEIVPSSVSEHCLKAAGSPSSQDKPVTQDRVKYLCDSDSTNYTVLVGLIEGSSTLNLMRPDNTRANYAIHYSNLKATPDSVQLTQIIDSFQTR